MALQEFCDKMTFPANFNVFISSKCTFTECMLGVADACQKHLDVLCIKYNETHNDPDRSLEADVNAASPDTGSVMGARVMNTLAIRFHTVQDPTGKMLKPGSPTTALAAAAQRLTRRAPHPDARNAPLVHSRTTALCVALCAALADTTPVWGSRVRRAPIRMRETMSATIGAFKALMTIEEIVCAVGPVVPPPRARWGSLRGGDAWGDARRALGRGGDRLKGEAGGHCVCGVLADS